MDTSSVGIGEDNPFYRINTGGIHEHP